MRSPDFIRDRAKTLRRAMTQPEKTLWAMIRRDHSGCTSAASIRRRGWASEPDWDRSNRAQEKHPFVLDFYCAAIRLAVEVDGPVHDDQPDRDDRRTAWLTKEGIRVLRFSVADIETRPAAVTKTIAQAAPPSTGFAGPPAIRPQVSWPSHLKSLHWSDFAFGRFEAP